MQVRNIILGVAGVAVLLSLLLLAMKVRGEAEPEIDERELASALARHRSSSASSARPPAARERRTARRAPSRRPPAARAEEEEREPEPDEPDPNEPATEPRSAPRISIVGEATNEDAKELMATATRYYDRGDYPSAEDAALDVLKEHPRHIKMLRVVVSTSCIMGNADQAREYFMKLPDRDKGDMRKRCSYYGVEFEEE